MIVTCSNCTTRLQLEDSKIPSRAFTVRCPKCQFIINAQPAGSVAEGSALAVAGDMPASARQREVKTPSASSGAVEQSVEVSGRMPSAPSVNEGEVARLLAALLQNGLGDGAASKTDAGRRWRQRRALICTGRSHREATARLLSQNQYEIFIADDTAQAIERMREEQMDVVILDPDFDAMEQGAAFINRELNSLRPAQRRRVFFVHLMPNVRTADPHAAFLHHVNLVVNPEDIEDLPRVMERSIRALNELYRDFNKALNVAEL
jgi:predicted Zn finger-like uncharacterized protein